MSHHRPDEASTPPAESAPVTEAPAKPKKKGAS